MTQQVRGVLLDIDGTLVNSNDAHAHSWVDAMEELGYHADFEKVRPLIGMGGDKVLPDVLGIQKDSEQGKKIEQRRKDIFKQKYLPTVKPFPKAKELLQRMHDDGLTLVVATSSTPDELKSMLDIIGPHVQDLMAQETTAKDAPKSKPNPQVIDVAIQRSGHSASELLMLGDTPYDIESAAKASVKTVALRSGGWGDKDLSQAIAIYDNTADLLEHYDESPFKQGIPVGA
ncbi:MAG TPA: hydrolase [Ktedonobacter sp.]|nr:hydrolase [Ktedonobacter sp.]